MRPSSPVSDVLVRVRGIVQGVGFRPFVQRTATRLGLRGWVRNDPQGVLLRAMGREEQIAALVAALQAEAPSAAQVREVAFAPGIDSAAPAGETFTIAASAIDTGAVDMAVPPDLALCAECRGELLDATNRRHEYAFINCTQCGPRYSIIEGLPYDRPRTTMRGFGLCPQCRREYETPLDRRYHAEPNACPNCGPTVTFSVNRAITGSAGVSALAFGSDRERTEATGHAAAISAAARLLRAGKIVAVKGVGGYHLLVDATQTEAVAELRRRKHRDEKPLAVMFRDLAAIGQFAEISTEAATLLASPTAPIVLVPKAENALAPNVAPENPWIGALLAYAPLHVLLLRELDFPVVATSANLAEEPLCAANDEAHRRLAPIADAWLEHNRPIAHPVDDSVVRLTPAGPIWLRSARGAAPRTLSLPAALMGNWLCVGGQMKNTVAVASGERLVLSPHIGDLSGAATIEAFRGTVQTLSALHRSDFSNVACDKHPDYASTRFAARTGLPTVAVQHHLAHVLACLLEHRRAPDGVLGVAWDGTGFGEDHTVWGGEFLLLQQGKATRFGRLRPFRLPGGEAAVRDARRVALGLLHAAGHAGFSGFAQEFGLTGQDADVLRTMLTRGLNSPVTSSMGRLFDAVGAFLGVGRSNHFEGQIPLAVEALNAGLAYRGKMRRAPADALALPVREIAPGGGAHCELDWQPMLEGLLRKKAAGTSPSELALDFHHGLATATVEVARRAGVSTVALTGGCFQNALLLELTATSLRAAGFSALTHRQLPPNDGNIAAGQALGALWGLTSVQLP